MHYTIGLELNLCPRILPQLMFQEKIPTISIQQPILLNTDPHRRVVMNTKGTIRKTVDTLSLEK